MGEKEEYNDCVQEQTTDFNNYDQNVDVVSCWEEFLTNVYASHFDSYFFDRFPSIPQPEGDPLTPDFTVFFNDEYGIIFEVSRTMPNNAEAFESELDQIRSYDDDLSLRTGDGRETPENHDIAFLVGSTDSFNIADKIQDRIESGELDLESNLILLEYHYTEQDRDPGYQFRRIPTLDQNFDDPVLPASKRLSTKLASEHGGYENIFIPPKDFVEYKVSGVLCNDTPPALYLACFLWHKVFYDYLSDSQRRIWNRKNPQKIIEIEIDLDELQDRINSEYIPDGFVRKNWLRQTLQFLEVAELAEDTDPYTVKYRNLRKKRNQYRDQKSQKTKFSDLAQLFSSYYCQQLVGYDEEEVSLEEDEVEADTSSQSELGEF